MTEESVQKTAQTGPVRFKDAGGEDVEIFPSQPLPQFDSGPVKAYGARLTGGRSAGDGIAYVCEKHITPRVHSTQGYRNVSNPVLAPLLAHGRTYWTPTKQHRYVFVYRRVPGEPVQKPDQEAALGWRQDLVMETVVKPMTLLLKDMRDTNFVHSGIRPSNMLAPIGGKFEHIVLGDCLSTSPSSLQPVLFETIERGMAAPLGRGLGTPADDMYAFGVSLAILMRTSDPLKGLSDDEIIKEKLENGSYAAITGKDRFKGSILELLRGLLHDDARERWTVEEVMTWLDGRRISPKQSTKHKKASRPIAFENRKYIFAPHLAMDLPHNSIETAKLVESGDLEQWLQRSLDDPETQERTDMLVRNVREKGTGQGYEDRLASNLSIALDPFAPIRYRTLRMQGDGIGTMLAESIVLKKDLQPFVDLFMQGMAFSWVTNTKNPAVDQGSLIARFDQCRNYIRHGKIGFGIERCVYTLSPESPCFSEKLKDYWVTSPESLMVAFEDMCQNGNAPAMFLDRHITAFLSVKDSKNVDSCLYELGAPEEYKKILGNLKALGLIQKSANMQKFPGIAKVFAENLPVLLGRYHDRALRTRLETQLRKHAEDGDLSKMSALLSNPETQGQDSHMFRSAMIEYNALRNELATLESRLNERSTFGRSTGREVAAIVSSIIAGIVMMATAAMFFL